MSSTIFYIQLKEHCVLGVKKLISKIRILECYRKIVNMRIYVGIRQSWCHKKVSKTTFVL